MNKLCSLLVYDIPEDSGIKNPSSFLRRRAVRINLSCWVIPNDRVPWTRLNSMLKKGASWHVVKFDEAEAEKLALLAISAITNEIRQVIRAAQESESKAENNTSTPEGKRAYWARVRSSLYRAKLALQDAREAAKAFGLDSIDINGATQLIYRMQVDSRRKALAHVRAAEVLEQNGYMHGKAMASALRADEPDANLIAADMLDDNGECELSESLRS